MILKELFVICEKIHKLDKGANSPARRGSPEDKARAFDKPGTNRSVIQKIKKAKREQNEYWTTGEADSDSGDFSVLVMGSKQFDDEGRERAGMQDYSGISVAFGRDGSVKGNTFDKAAAREWKNDKDEIIAVARKDFAKAIAKHVKDGDAGSYTTLPKINK